MNRYLSCLRLNAVLFCKIFTCGFLGQKDYAEGYDNVAENYDDNWLCHIKPCTQNFLDRLPPLQSDKPIVDLGCGTGFSTEWLTKRYDNPVTGVDISAGMLKQAAKKMPQTQFVHADMLDYLRKLPAESRAMICSAWAIGYSDPKRIAEEACRVLEAKGVFAFIVNTADTLPGVFDAFRRTMYNYPQKVKKLLWPKFPKDFSFVDDKRFETLYQHKDSIKIHLREEDFSDWLFKTGIMAGFEKVLDTDLFKKELKKSTAELCHRHIIGIYRKK